MNAPIAAPQRGSSITTRALTKTFGNGGAGAFHPVDFERFFFCPGV